MNPHDFVIPPDSPAGKAIAARKALIDRERESLKVRDDYTCKSEHDATLAELFIGSLNPMHKHREVARCALQSLVHELEVLRFACTREDEDAGILDSDQLGLVIMQMIARAEAAIELDCRIKEAYPEPEAEVSP